MLEVQKELEESSPKFLNYCQQYEVTNFEEKCLLYVSYLTEEMRKKEIGSDDVFTCFRFFGEKLPIALRQTLRNIGT